jgi:CheY-like chemotaxis protein
MRCLDINMRAVRFELAACCRTRQPPAVVFVTAHDDKAVAAFDVGAVDYLLKPIRSDRLDEAVRRVTATRSAEPARAAPEDRAQDPDVIPAELGGITQLIRRDAIGWVEAEGDYSRLHSESGAHLVRIPLSTLETRWADQVSNGALVVSGVAVDGDRDAHGRVCDGAARQRCLTCRGAPWQPRQVRELRDRLIRYPMRGYRSVRGDGSPLRRGRGGAHIDGEPALRTRVRSEQTRSRCARRGLVRAQLGLAGRLATSGVRGCRRRECGDCSRR